MTSKKNTLERRTKSVSINDDDSNHSDDELIEQLRQKALSVNVEKYEINSRVLCQHSDHMFYDAKIINVEINEGGKIVYTIHYAGWNARYDEKIPHEIAKSKFIPFDQETAELAKKAIYEARKQIKRKVEKKVEKKKTQSRRIRPKKASSTASSKSESVAPSESTIAKIKNTRKSESSDDEFDFDSELFVNDPQKPFIENKRGCEVIGSRVLDTTFVDDNDLITRQMKIPRIPARFTVNNILNDYIEDIKRRDREGNWEALHHDPVNKIKQDLHIIVKFFNNILYQRLLYKVEIALYIRTLASIKGKESLVENSQFGLIHDEDVMDTVNAIKEAMRQKERQAENEDADNSDKRNTYKIKKMDKKKFAKNKVEKSKDDEDIDENFSLNCAEYFGFIHWIRFLYFFGKLIKSDIMKEIGVDRRVNLLNDLIVFLSTNINKYYDVNLDYEVPDPPLLREAFLHQ